MTKRVTVALIGCGAPLKSMGWYHAIQLIDGRVPDADLQFVVEPWYFSEAAKTAPGYTEFHEWRKQQQENGIQFFANVSELPPPAQGEIRLVIISARTADNPALLDACLKVCGVGGGSTAVYLEKPGAPSVKELEAMRDKAGSVKVFMGFNKNISNYLISTREFASAQDQKCDVTFLHNNNYPNTTEALAECFERNSEGMLKNMAIHELAILVTYYAVTVDSIANVQADKEFSSLQTLKGPSSGQMFTDFDKLKFKVVTKAGVEINVAADRCGGDDSVGIVTASGKELARYSMPDDAAIANIPNLQANTGDAMPYFFTQDPDYLKLKQLVVQNIVNGTPAEGVATIDIAIETLKVAEYLTPILQEQLK